VENTKKFIKLWSPPVIYAILIYWLSSLERPFVIDLGVNNFDKLIHLVEYAIFGFLLIRAIKGSGNDLSIKNALIITFIIGTFCGFTDELHQSVVPGRYATMADFIFDSIGTFTGAILFSITRKIGAANGKDTSVSRHIIR